MSVTIPEVKHIANLARLELSEAELEKFSTSLSNIMILADQLLAIDTGNISPLAHSQETSQPLRDDIITEGDNRKALLQNAPAAESDLFLVPQVIE